METKEKENGIKIQTDGEKIIDLIDKFIELNSEVIILKEDMKETKATIKIKEEEKQKIYRMILESRNKEDLNDDKIEYKEKMDPSGITDDQITSVSG